MAHEVVGSRARPKRSPAIDSNDQANENPDLDSDPKSRGRRRLAIRLVPPFLLAIAVQYEIAVHDLLPSVDGLAFLEVGKNMLAGDGYVRQGSPELHFPPVVPTAIGALHWIFGSDMAAIRIWGVTTGLAVTAMVVLLARRLSDDDDGVTVAAAWLAATVPGLSIVMARTGGGTEAPALAFLLGAAYLVVGVLRSPDRPFPRLVGAGALCALAYLTRPESLLPALALGCAVLLRAARTQTSETPRARATRSLRWGAAFGMTFVILAAPYVAFLHSHTGSWEFTSKSGDASISAWRAVARHDKVARDKVLYRIDPATDRLGQPTRSLTTLAAEDPAGWLGIARSNGDQVFGQFFNIHRTAVGLHSPLLPALFLLPAGWQFWRSRKRPGVPLLAVLAAIPIITCVAFFMHARYLVLATAVVTIFAAWGLVELHRKLPSRLPVVPVVSAVLLASSLVYAVGYRHPFRWSDAVKQKAAGEWIARHAPADAKVMTRSYHVQYYGHRPVVAMPYAGFDDVLAFARRHGVQYIVADRTSIRGRRPQLVRDLVETRQPKGLRTAYESPGGVFRIFTLDPPAPPNDKPPIPLGYVSD